MKQIIKRILREQRQFDSNYLLKVSNILLQSGPPYFQLIEDNFNITDENDQLEVLKFIYGDDITTEIDYNDDKNIHDINDNVIYRETGHAGYWWKKEYDSNDKCIYHEDSEGYWEKTVYDEKGNQIYFVENDGYWYKKEYDSKGNQIYYENSNGQIIDNRNTDERHHNGYYDY